MIGAAHHHSADRLVPTGFLVLYPDGATNHGAAGLLKKPSWDALAALIAPLIGADFEHVSVLTADGHVTDMFVDENRDVKRLPRNEIATRFLRRAAMRVNPDRDPETLPLIRGPAVLFARRVWF